MCPPNVWLMHTILKHQNIYSHAPIIMSSIHTTWTGASPLYVGVLPGPHRLRITPVGCEGDFWFKNRRFVVEEDDGSVLLP